MPTVLIFKEGKVVDSWKGHTTDNLARHFLLHPRRPKAYLSHIRSKITVAHDLALAELQL